MVFGRLITSAACLFMHFVSLLTFSRRSYLVLTLRLISPFFLFIRLRTLLPQTSNLPCQPLVLLIYSGSQCNSVVLLSHCHQRLCTFAFQPIVYIVPLTEVAYSPFLPSILSTPYLPVHFYPHQSLNHRPRKQPDIFSSSVYSSFSYLFSHP